MGQGGLLVIQQLVEYWGQVVSCVFSYLCMYVLFIYLIFLKNNKRFLRH